MWEQNLLIEPLSTPGVMAAKLLLPFGSVQDPPDQRGAHELLASLLSRGCGPLDHEAVADLVEGSGAGLRCDAQEDGLMLSLRCTVECSDLLMPLLAWMVLEPHLHPDQVALERSLTLQALQRQCEDPFHMASVGWRTLVYGTGAYGHDPMGVAEDLTRLDRDRLLPLAGRLPLGQPVLAIAGTFPAEITEQLAETKGFAQWPEPTIRTESTQPEYCLSSGSESIHLQPMETEQVVMMLGQATISHGHPDDLSLRLLQCHLGVGMSSLLFRRLREEHGVAYEVAASYPALAGPAPFMILASTGMERAHQSLRLLLQCWDELRQKQLSRAELDLACAKFIGQVAHSRQTCSQRAERRVQLRAMGLADDHDQRSMNAVRNLTPEALCQAADRWLNQPKLSLCGPSESLGELQRLWNAQSAPSSSAGSTTGSS